jgi:hypothetical protein
MELASQSDTSNDAHLLVRRLLADLEAAGNSGDLHAYAALYAADAGYVSRTGRLLNVQKLSSFTLRRSRELFATQD